MESEKVEIGRSEDHMWVVAVDTCESRRDSESIADTAEMVVELE